MNYKIKINAFMQHAIENQNSLNIIKFNLNF